LKSESAAAALPAHAAVMTGLSLPLSDPRKIAATAGYELESSMPYELSDVIFDYRVDSRSDEGSKLAVTYAASKEVGSLLDSLSAAQLDPRYVVSPAQALKFASRLMDPAKTPGGPYLVIDAGARYALLCVVDGSDMPTSRAVRFPADLPENPSAAVKDLVEATARFLAESALLLVAAYGARTNGDVQAVFLCGGRSLLPGLPERLAELLTIPCEPLHGNIHGGMDPETASRFALPMALALESAMGLRREVVNFRKDRHAFRGEYKFLMGKLVFMGAAVALILLLAVSNTVLKFRMISAHEDALDGRLQEVTKALLGKPYDDYKIALSIMKQKISPQASPIPKTTAYDHFLEISSRIPKDILLDLREISIQNSKIRIEGDTESFESVDKIVNGLKTNKCFEDINKGRVKKSIDGTKVEFDLTMNPKC
jgi:general secretion pathway protein L